MYFTKKKNNNYSLHLKTGECKECVEGYELDKSGNCKEKQKNKKKKIKLLFISNFYCNYYFVGNNLFDDLFFHNKKKSS